MKKIILKLSCAILMLGLITGCGNSNINNSEEQLNNDTNNNSSENNKYKKEDKIYDVHKTNEPNNESITKLTFSYNGKTLTYPFTLKDVESLGLLVDEEYKIEQIRPGTGMGNIDVFIGNYMDENKVVLGVVNETGNTISSGDCVVNYVSVTNEKISINGLTPGKTNYKDILEKYGRDSENRKNTFYNENLRQINEGDFSRTFIYSSESENFYWCYLEISLEQDYENNSLIDSVQSVVYKQGR